MWTCTVGGRVERTSNCEEDLKTEKGLSHYVLAGGKTKEGGSERKHDASSSRPGDLLGLSLWEFSATCQVKIDINDVSILSAPFSLAPFKGSLLQFLTGTENY